MKEAGREHRLRRRVGPAVNLPVFRALDDEATLGFPLAGHAQDFRVSHFVVGILHQFRYAIPQ